MCSTVLLTQQNTKTCEELYFMHIYLLGCLAALAADF